MALVTTKEMFRKAYEGKYAVGAFNVDNIDIMQGVLAGAQKVQAPVMVAFSEGALKFIHPAYVRAAAEAAAQELDIPFAIHLDHGKTVELCKKCVDNGFTSVMIDASSYDFETNIAMTKEVVEYAHARGVVVESELGAIAGIEDDVVVADKYGQFTHPDDAVEFVERTGIDSLAIAIGTAHGAYKFKPGQKPQLRFDILEEVREKLPGFPLVLHGASSVPHDRLEIFNTYGGQMPGVDGVALKGLHNVSYQSPLGEDINMNFLIMLTSDPACEKLTAAYKSYFGKDYNPAEDEVSYNNIGYKFVAEFIKNVGYWHSSDSKEVKAINNYADDGRIIFAGLCKLKDYEYYKADYKDTDQYYTKTVTAAGWNNDVEGFDGFVYNMWMLIPETAQLPYTSCLFIHYLLSEEGFNAGWGGILGYYSSNQNIPSVEGDPALAVWKEQCIVEDVDYLDTAYRSAVKFINMQMAGK